MRIPWQALPMAVLLALASGQGAAGTFAATLSAEYLPHAAASPGPGPVAARHQGGLYRVSRNGRIAYLFGTVHVGASSFYPLAPEVSGALAGANRVVVELDTRSDDAFGRAVNKHGSYADGDDLRKHIARETCEQLIDALHARGISLASMARLKPWLVANILLGVALEHDGFHRSEGVEQVLLADAQSRGAPIAELESADYQLSLFDTMDDIQS